MKVSDEKKGEKHGNMIKNIEINLVSVLEEYLNSKLTH